MRLYKILPAAVAAIILVAIIAYTNPVLLANELMKSDLQFILLALVVSTISAVMRVLKWSVLINVGIKSLFPVQILGLTISNFTPGKIAEPAKAVLLKMRHGTDVSASLPSIIWERVNDLLVLITLSLIAIQTLALEKNMLFIGFISIGIFAFTIALFILTVKNERFGKRIFGVFRKFPILNKISENFIDTFYKNKIKKRMILTGLLITVIPWLMEGYIFYFALRAVGIEAEPFKLAGIIALAVLIGVLSSLPGGLGSFEAVMIVMLGIIGIAGTTAIAGLILYRFLSFFYVAFLGWLSFLYLSRHMDVKSVLK